MKPVLLIGAGAMARAIAWDLTHREPRIPLNVLDRDERALTALVAQVSAPVDPINSPPRFPGGIKGGQSSVPVDGLETIQGDASDEDLIRKLMARCSLAIGALGYRFNVRHTEFAIESGAHWIDLGGNNDVVDKQFKQNDNAVTAGVTVVPDCGLAPGLANVLGGDAFRLLDTVDELQIRVGGLSQDPKPPLYYGLLFSPDGLANEYYEPAQVIENGELCTVESLTGWERVYIGAPFGTLEAFHTSGGSSTMVHSFLGRVKALDYKTLRYPGHLRRVKLLKDLGLFDPVAQDSVPANFSPRDMFALLAERTMGWVERDVTVVYCRAVGTKDGAATAIEWRLIDEFEPATGLTSMARTTGFSAAVVARMILDGRICDKGVVTQELSVPPEEFLEEMRLRGVDVKRTVKRL